jgi:hypothetical protein
MEQLAAAFHTSGLEAPAYTTLAGTIRRFLVHYNESAGYEDAYFISLQGRVVFSARQRDDFGADLRAVPYRETELARVFERTFMLIATELSDFSPYAPAGKPWPFSPPRCSSTRISSASPRFNSAPTRCTRW